jgi:hypothetical protein
VKNVQGGKPGDQRVPADEGNGRKSAGSAAARGSWPQGAEKIQGLLDLEHLERISVDERFVETQLQDAEDNIASVGLLAGSNPRLAYVALYDAARYAIEAALAVQGLRPTPKGGHTVAIDALIAQLGKAGGCLRPMDRIRKRRIDAEYPYPDTPLIAVADVTDDLPKVTVVVATMRQFVGVVGEFGAG